MTERRTARSHQLEAMNHSNMSGYRKRIISRHSNTVMKNNRLFTSNTEYSAFIPPTVIVSKAIISCNKEALLDAEVNR